MRRRLTVCSLLVTLVPIFLLVASCGPDETPEQKLERLRYNHDIVPLGYTTVTDAEGNPTLLVDLQVVNQGTEKLDTLTVLVTVRDPEGNEKASERVSLDLSDVRPGVGTQIAAQVPGVAAEEGDEVMVEIEPDLSPEDLRSLPEYSSVTS